MPHARSGSVVLRQTTAGLVVVKRARTLDMRDEAAALRLAAKSGVPVPRVLASSRSELTLEYLHGHTLGYDDLVPPVINAIAAALKRLGQIGKGKVGPIRAPRKGSRAALIAYLRSIYRARLQKLVRRKHLTRKEERLLETAFTRAASSLPRKVPTGLVHEDLHMNNVLRDGGKIYLIDPADAFYGDQMYDLATALHFDRPLFLALRPRMPWLFTDGWEHRFLLSRLVQRIAAADFECEKGLPKSTRRYIDGALQVARRVLDPAARGVINLRRTAA